MYLMTVYDKPLHWQKARRLITRFLLTVYLKCINLEISFDFCFETRKLYFDQLYMIISHSLFYLGIFIDKCKDHTSRHRVLNRRMAARSIYGYAGDFGPDTAIRDLQLIRELGESLKGEVSRPLDHIWLTPCYDQHTNECGIIADD